MQISVTQQFNIRVLLGSATQKQILKGSCESTWKKSGLVSINRFDSKFHWSVNYTMQSLKQEIIYCFYVLTTEKHWCKKFLPFSSWGFQTWESQVEIQPHVACTLCKVVHYRWYRMHWICCVHTAEMHRHVQRNVFQNGLTSSHEHQCAYRLLHVRPFQRNVQILSSSHKVNFQAA